MRLSNCVLSSLVILMLTACAGNQPRATQGDVTAAAAIHTQLDEAAQRLEQALHEQEGQPTQRRQVTEALDGWRAIATQCAQTRGCDNARVVATTDRLLRLSLQMQGAMPMLGEDDATDALIAEQEAVARVDGMPDLGGASTVLNGRELNEVMTLNGPVRQALEKWLTQYRPNLVNAWVNYQYMRPLMAPEYQRAGLPEAILFGIMAQESGGRVHAVSRSGASGPLQFMYATGTRFGLRTVDGFDQRFDPALSARANAAYLTEQLKRHDNNIELVLAAYNGGEGRVGRLAARFDNPSFWDPQLYFELPRETRDYVPMVLAAAWLYLHPERYNLEFPSLANNPGVIILEQPASLAQLTVCLGQQAHQHDGWFRTLRNLNPALDPHQQQAAATRIAVPQMLESAYARSCTAGPWAELAAELHEAVVPADLSAPPKPRNYVIRRGDTLAGIARKLGCGSASEIARINGLRSPHAIRAGQRLDLPRC